MVQPRKHKNVVCLGMLWLCLLVLPHMTQAASRQDPPDGQPTPRLLETGKPIERELKGGESHSYQIKLEAGQFLHVVVEQKGIDVVVLLFGPDGKQLAEVDSPNGLQGPEPVYWVTEAAGNYKLEVRSLEKNVRAGRYQAKIEELRATVPTDKPRLAAQQAIIEADVFYARQNKESFQKAIPKYEAAIALLKTLGDHNGEAEALSKIGEVWYYLREWQNSLDYFNQSVLKYRIVGNRSGESQALHNLGFTYTALGENRKALAFYRQALDLRHAVDYIRR